MDWRRWKFARSSAYSIDDTIYTIRGKAVRTRFGRLAYLDNSLAGRQEHGLDTHRHAEDVDEIEGVFHWRRRHRHTEELGCILESAGEVHHRHHKYGFCGGEGDTSVHHWGSAPKGIRTKRDQHKKGRSTLVGGGA